MNPAIYIAIFLPIFIILIQAPAQNRIIINNIVKRKTKKENYEMMEHVKKFIGKECYIYTIQSMSSPIKGIIKDVDDNSIILETKKTKDVINLDYVMRVSEIQKNK